MGWTNVASSVLTANTVIVIAGAPNAGVFVYSPSPGAGNLILSIAADAGVDPYGNTYLAGTTSYSSTRYSRLFDGGLFIGPMVAGVPDTVNFGGLVEDDSAHMEMIGVSSGSGTTTNPTITLYTAGDDSIPTGTSNTPRKRLLDGFGTSAADYLISGSVIHTNLTGTADTWQTPTFSAGWADGSGIGGNYPGLKWRYDAENNLHIHGTFHATVAAPAVAIASGIPPSNMYSGGGNVGIVGVAHYVSNNAYALPLFLTTTGFLVASVIAAFPGVNSTFIIDGIVPIGNIP